MGGKSITQSQPEPRASGSCLSEGWHFCRIWRNHLRRLAILPSCGESRRQLLSGIDASRIDTMENQMRINLIKIALMAAALIVVGGGQAFAQSALPTTAQVVALDECEPSS